MAPTMMCPAHGPQDGPSCSDLSCFEPLRPYVGSDDPAEETCGAQGCGMPLPCRLHPSALVRAEVADHRAVARLAPEGTPAQSAISVRLRFPWGPVAVLAGGLIIGRDFVAECGAAIEAFDNVSRRHAKIYMSYGRIVLEDLASTNGTTINGTPTAAHKPQQVQVGDVLGFGAHLRAVIQLAEPDR